jgi:guanylate kinase
MSTRKTAAASEPISGCLFILSAPSGAGKTTLSRAVLERFSGLRYSVSHTTRQPRCNEREGIDYHFIDTEEFEKGIAQGRWAEWAKVHGHFYGTSAPMLERWMKEKNDVLLDIDVQGALQLMASYPSCVSIFIMPPSLEVLRQRLCERGADDDQSIALRLKNAEEEMLQKDRYRYVIVNDRLADAVESLAQIIQKHRARP